jgi:hypothetical protein
MLIKNPLVTAIFTILLTACGGGGGGSQSAPQTNPGGAGDQTTTPPVTLSAYLSDSPYNEDITRCVIEDICSLQTLPLVGLVTNGDTPTVDQIMNQVVVSHPWMGQRFRDLLLVMPEQMLQLFRSVTGVVISADIRPSHYRSSTGAIYLDPSLLWLTNAEKAVIDQAPDFRSDFGKDLQFVRIWRYVINNDYAWQSYSLTGNEERTLADTVVGLSWLLYHELAHANDCAPPQDIGNFVQSLSYAANDSLQRTAGNCVYQQLNNQNGLTSQTWLDLAQVLYQGANSNADQRNMSPIAAGDAFALDHAHDAYSYSSQREDVAMAFEAVMMKKHFNADRDMAIIPQYETFACDAAETKWGQRGRMALPQVRVRSKLVTDLILPDLALNDFYQNMPPVVEFNLDHNWCEPNLGQENVQSRQPRNDKQAIAHINDGYFID